MVEKRSEDQSGRRKRKVKNNTAGLQKKLKAQVKPICFAPCLLTAFLMMLV